jgi:sugar phosphate isomerase/epimerase
VRRPRLSVQLYSLRHIPDLEAQLRLVQQARLPCVETTTANYADPDRFRRLLERYELRAPTGHFGIDRLRNDFAATVALARSFGMETLYVWGLPEAEHPRDAGGWRRVGSELARWADRLADEGLGFGYHNHDWELTRFADGDYALDQLLDAAGPAPLRWQPDLGWLARGKADVSALLARHGARIGAAHVKDLASDDPAAPEQGWADLGAGRLPWSEWLPQLLAAGADPLVLEHDAPSDPARFITASASALRTLLEQVPSARAGS